MIDCLRPRRPEIVRVPIRSPRQLSAARWGPGSFLSPLSGFRTSGSWGATNSLRRSPEENLGQCVAVKRMATEARDEAAAASTEELPVCRRGIPSALGRKRPRACLPQLQAAQALASRRPCVVYLCMGAGRAFFYFGGRR
ncbi:unnamed protein product [Amoebophrya sp. A120]|nr:unnamed protein product [Amoebophrya sp. A120]|eukprot:GSA120T00023700001.1